MRGVKGGVPIPMADRFWPRVDASGECWEWVGYRDRSTGYGKLGGLWAHRVAYELLVGPIPAGLQIDHLCRNRGCVNPAHLEPVTHAENGRRGGAALTHCRARGHEYTPANTVIRPGGRACRQCIRDNSRIRNGVPPDRYRVGYMAPSRLAN